MSDVKTTAWTQKHIAKVPPIMMREPFLEMLGQIEGPLAYYYEEAVKFTGHSCGAVSGAWTITRKALEALYPNETPVRGQIKITAPGAEDEWVVGVFGEVMSYITGAAPNTGFPGQGFGQKYNRKNLITYKEEITNLEPPKMVWTFERIDTGKKVNVRYVVSNVQPQPTPKQKEMAAKMAEGTVTLEEAREWQAYWNARAEFVFTNADILEGLFVVEVL